MKTIGRQGIGSQMDGNKAASSQQRLCLITLFKREVTTPTLQSLAMPHLSGAAPEPRVPSVGIALFSLTVSRLEHAELLCLCHGVAEANRIPLRICELPRAVLLALPNFRASFLQLRLDR